MNEKTARLLELVRENPELPIVPMVDAEICGDDYGTYMGGWGNARVDEYIIAKEDDLVLFKSDDDVMDVLERVLSEDEFNALPDEDDECRPAYDALPWTKVIVVDIVTSLAE